MAGILLLAAPRVWGGNATRRFWIGFEMAGWSMALLFGYLSHSMGSDFFWAANSVYPWHTIRNWHIRLLYIMNSPAAVSGEMDPWSFAPATLRLDMRAHLEILRGFSHSFQPAAELGYPVNSPAPVASGNTIRPCGGGGG